MDTYSWRGCRGRERKRPTAASKKHHPQIKKPLKKRGFLQILFCGFFGRGIVWFWASFCFGGVVIGQINFWLIRAA
jgi:hypothetical protein